ESRHPQPELFEELVLPLPAHVRRCEDEHALNLAVKQQSTDRHARRNRLSEPYLVRYEPGPRILICETDHHLALVGLECDGARGLGERLSVGQPRGNANEACQSASAWRLFAFERILSMRLAKWRKVKESLPYRIRKRIDPEAFDLARPILLEPPGPE